MTQDKYVIGVDYGTDSVRALVLHALTGETVGTAVFEYPRWKKGLYCDASESRFRQHPLDYLEGLEQSVREALKNVPAEIRRQIAGISVDTTGSTPGPVDEYGTPLALLPEFAGNPNGMFILWKDHTSNREAEEINTLAKQWETDFTTYVGGIYSSEWFWAKMLHTLRVDPEVREKAFSWVEHCDWISAVLTGNTNPLTLKRSRCAAGHKALWHKDFNGLPSDEFLTRLDPLLSGMRDRLFSDTYTSDQPMGRISAEWAERLGISPDAIIGVGAFDAHMGAVGAEIEAYSLCKVIGTSTCDMLVAPTDEIGDLVVRGICGQVDGSILPGMLGMEAGMSAYGDIYAWFQRLIVQPVAELVSEEAAAELQKKLLPALSEKAALLPVTPTDPVAVDWFNGRRTPDANHTLKGAISGLNLGSDTVRVFKSLVEATAYGSRNIVDRFREEGVPIRQVIAIGGVARKSAFAMQTLANVLNVPIKVAASDQACALGAAMFAAVASGVHPTIAAAQEALSAGFDAVYEPEADKAAIYETLYARYLSLGRFLETGLIAEHESSYSQENA